MRSRALWRSRGRSAFRVFPSNGLERTSPAGGEQVDPHHDDRHGRERGGEGNVRLADLVLDDVADEAGTRAADEGGRDEIAERQREREDRARDDSRENQRQDYRTQRAWTLRPEVLGG